MHTTQIPGENLKWTSQSQIQECKGHGQTSVYHYQYRESGETWCTPCTPTVPITHSTYNRTLPKKHTYKWASERHRSSGAHAGCRSVPLTNWCVFKSKPNTSTCNKIWTIRPTCFTKRKLNGSFLHISTQWLTFIISLFAHHPPLSAHSLTRNFHWNILNFNLLCTITNQLVSPWCKKQKVPVITWIGQYMYLCAGPEL